MSSTFPVKWAWLLTGALLILGGALWHQHSHTSASASTSSQATDPAVESMFTLSMADAAGNTQALSQWRGKWLLVNFWATWCTPCVAEMPGLDQTQHTPEAKQVQFLGIGTEHADKVHGFQDKMHLGFPLLAGGYDALDLARALGDTQGVLPFTVLIDPKGHVVQSHTGALAPGQVSAWIASSELGRATPQ